MLRLRAEMNIRYFWPWLKAEFRWRVLGKRYDVRLTEDAQRLLDELPEEAQAEMRRVMDRLSRNPYSEDRMELDEYEAEGR